MQCLWGSATGGSKNVNFSSDFGIEFGTRPNPLFKGKGFRAKGLEWLVSGLAPGPEQDALKNARGFRFYASVIERLRDLNPEP